MGGSIRAFFAVLLLALFPVCVLALGGGGIVTGLAIGRRAGLYVAILSAGMLLAFGFALTQALRTRLTPPQGPRLTRQDQPRLWRMVEELAAQAHTRPPDEIVLVGEINAAVREDAKALGLRPGRRYMMIGLPLLAGLTVAELRSVLAHELGHYGGGHTRWLAASYRGAETLGRTVDRLDSGPARWVLGAYAWLYAVISRSANRAQELQADAYSVAAVGRSTAAGALRKITTMDLLWDAFVQGYLGLPVMAGRTPEILLGFRSFIEHPHQKRRIAEIESDVLDLEPKSLMDSHPTIRRRIAAIEALPDVAARPDARPGWALLANPDHVIPAAEATLLLTTDLGPRADWREIVRLAGAANADRGAELLAKAALESGLTRAATLSEILNTLHRGQGTELVMPLLRGGAPEQQRQVAVDTLIELLGDVVVSALISRERARHELNWAGAWHIVGPRGELSTGQLVGPAITDPTLVPQLRQYLVTLGVPMDYVRTPGERPRVTSAESREPALVGAAPEVWAFRKTWDVLVHDTGLLFVPLTMGQLLRQSIAGAAGQATQVTRKRISRLLDWDSGALFQRADVRWIPLGDMREDGRKKLLSGGGKLKVRFSDGTTTTLRTRIDGSFAALTNVFDAMGAELAR